MVLVAGLACGDSGSPVVPTSITIVSGNNQSALPGEALAQQLRVTVMGSSGGPYVGATVTWAVATGSAALNPTTATTSATGEATTNVTIGVTPGNVVITATVTGVAPATFNATALDPCDVLTPLTTTAITGVLTAFDCQFPTGFFTDWYTADVPAQAGLVVSMQANTFDTYLEFYHLSGPFLGVNDDRAVGDTNSRIVAILATGSYVFAASSFNANVTGSYTISQAGGNEVLAGCPVDALLKWVTRGVALSEQVQQTDCVVGRANGGPAYVDRVLISLSPSRSLSATLASAAFAPRLELYQLSNLPPGTTMAPLVGSVNGSGGTATLNYTVPGSGAISTIFRLDITAADTGQTGAYSLNIAGPLPGEAASVLPIGPAAWRAVTAARSAPGRARKD